MLLVNLRWQFKDVEHVEMINECMYASKKMLRLKKKGITVNFPHKDEGLVYGKSVWKEWEIYSSQSKKKT